MTELEVGIVTDDLEAMTAFYIDGLGFSERSTIEFPEGTVRRLRRDRAYLKLYLPSTGALAPPLPDPWHRDRGFAYAALNVDDLEREVPRVAAHGGTVIVPITNHRPGACFSMIADPQGNRWELLQEAVKP